MTKKYFKQRAGGNFILKPGAAKIGAKQIRKLGVRLCEFTRFQANGDLKNINLFFLKNDTRLIWQQKLLNVKSAILCSSKKWGDTIG